ncbi:MAG: hypothetical protein LIO52_04955 [Oscillospiraceae bacterium]|nr:hypothetical protein [Oscillospiraceae bacterium]
MTSEHVECSEAVIINDALEESIAAFYAALSERGIEPAITMPNINVSRTLNRAALLRVFSSIYITL